MILIESFILILVNKPPLGIFIEMPPLRKLWGIRLAYMALLSLLLFGSQVSLVQAAVAAPVSPKPKSAGTQKSAPTAQKSVFVKETIQTGKETDKAATPAKPTEVDAVNQTGATDKSSSSQPSAAAETEVMGPESPDDEAAELKRGELDAPAQTPPAAAGQSFRVPFNLGATKSVIDMDAEKKDLILQGGANAGGGLAPPMKGSADSSMLKGGTRAGQIQGGLNQGQLQGGLTQTQLQRLASHDLVLIIDESSSMRTVDCPPSGVGRVSGTIMGMLLGSAACISRWDWCREQTMHLAEQTRFISPKGLSVVLFSSRYAVFPFVTLNQIPEIFNKNVPEGNTDLTSALRVTLDDYFRRRARGRVKPLAVAVITDGLPNNEVTVCQSIVGATGMMQDPREITITFFMIGNGAYTGQAFVNELDHNLGRYGGRYNIVRSVSFWNLMKVGLARALAESLE